jgi:hypothetical protein
LAKRKNIKKWSKSTTAAGKKAKTGTEHLPPLNRNQKSVLDDSIELRNCAMEVRHDKVKARSQKYEVQKLEYVMKMKQMEFKHKKLALRQAELEVGSKFRPR